METNQIILQLIQMLLNPQNTLDASGHPASETHGFSWGGFGIAVLDKGFIYVGNITAGNGQVKISDAYCIRRWGTERGLGQLALEGKQENTKLDKTGTVIAPITDLKHILPSEANKWEF